MQTTQFDVMSINMMNMLFMTVGTSIITSLATTITKVLTIFIPWFWDHVKKLFTPKQHTVTIQYTTTYNYKNAIWISSPDENNNQVLIKAILNFVSKLPEQSESTKCSLSVGEESKTNNYDYANSKKLEMAPDRYIIYNEFKINYSENEKNSEEKEGNQKKIIITISSRKSIIEIKEFIRQCYNEYISIIYKKSEREPTYLYKQIPSKEGLRFKKYPICNNTKFDSLFFPEKEKIIDLADRVNTGSLNKLALLLYGKPGCGKTSLIKALANHLDYHIIEVKLSFMVNDAALMDTFHNKIISSHKNNDSSFGIISDYVPLNKRIYIFEDIDAESNIIHQRSKPEEPIEEAKNIESSDSIDETFKLMMKKYMKKEKLTLSGILNVLDGIIEINGSVIIFTTNHPEKLDEAFKRPGRITMTMELKKMLSIEANKLIKHKFGKKIDNIHDYVFTPALLASYCQIASNFDELKYLVETYQNQ
ncbi:putative AAA+ family ATPase [Cotonvirus japonicus]|uniref:AAA+ family ATPase n=1 Tax=Cotonvirus japonicus TaxID=2811091 RepID=A0ABM7NSX9_9VIRU|nr:putative AAA+ family ATPase [Cotonvirus japonicus]BCS83249.1 putative AAA+ family ATPase [Cotonvirus japonicus]